MKTIVLILVCMTVAGMCPSAEARRSSRDRKSEKSSTEKSSRDEVRGEETPPVAQLPESVLPKIDAEPRQPATPGLLQRASAQPSEGGYSDKTLSNGATSTELLLMLLLFAGVIVGAVYLMSRSKNQTLGMGFDIIASKSVAPRTRLLWLNAGPKELVISVAGTRVKCIAQWETQPKSHKKADIPDLEISAPAPMPVAAELPVIPTMPKHRPTPTWEAPHVSTDSAQSVSGLFQLRNRMTAYEQLDSDPEEQDAVWQRELASALEERTGSNF